MLLVLAIGVSRVYLGVHYPSDVLAGWIAGAFWLIFVVIAEYVWPPPPAARLSLQRRIIIAVVLLALVLVEGFSLSGVEQSIPPPPTTVPTAPIAIATDDVPATVVEQLPHHTETLFGDPQEPVNLIFVGTQAELERAFQAAGWSRADKLEWASLKRALLVSATNRPDPNGIVTPSFLAEQPNALAFSQPVGATFARRHHIRIWTTALETTTGQQVWLAPASFDRGFQLAPTAFLPTHQIAPDIDTERDYIVADLQRSGGIAKTVTLQLVPPELGHNFGGDPFFTYGKAVVLWLR